MTEAESGFRRCRRRILVALVLCSLVVVGTTALTGVAAAEEGVTDCTVVDESGTYVLENDVSTDQTGDGASCIEIVSSDVVLDGNGHAVVAGDPVEWSGGNYGIHVTGVSNVTVRNVSTTGWDELGYGIKVDTSTDVLLSDLGAENNTFGAALDQVDSVELDDAAISRSERAGLQVLESSSVLIRDGVLSENAGVDGWSGIDVRDASTTKVEFDNVTVEDSRMGGHGIYVQSSGSNVTVENSTMAGNDGTGLLVESDGVSVTDTETTGNRWSVTAGDGASVAVSRIDVGHSTAPGTALNLSARNVRLRANASPPSSPAAQGIGRYFEVESLDNASLDVAVHYEAADVEDVDEESFHLRRFDGSQWVEVSDSTVDTGAMTVTASPSQLPQSERSTFGVFAEAQVASFEVSAVNETVIQGEPLAVKLTNVTDDGGNRSAGRRSSTSTGRTGRVRGW